MIVWPSRTRVVMVIRPPQFPEDPAVPVHFENGAAHERLLAEKRVVRHLTVVEERSAIGQIAVQPGPMRHLPGMGHLASHIDQIDGAVAGHRREQRVSRLRQRRIVRDQPGPRAPYLLLVDGGHVCLPWRP